MNNIKHPLKRCRKQRIEGNKQTLINNRNITQLLMEIATKMSNSAYKLHDPKEIIREAVLSIEKIRSEHHA